mgnify:CR=1 FL=1
MNSHKNPPSGNENKILTRDSNYGGNVGDDEYSERKNEHKEQSENQIKLFLPEFCIESVGHALLKFFNEWSLSDAEYNNLKIITNVKCQISTETK